MPNISTIVTNDDVTNFIPTLSVLTTDSREEIIVKAAEATIENYCNRTFKTLPHVDEEYDVDRELRIHRVVIRPYNIIRLIDYPVDLSEAFTAKFVTERDQTTGLPSASTVINRNSFNVEASTGIIHLYRNTSLSNQVLPGFSSSNSVISFPEGVARILFTYTSGFSEANIPYDLRMGMLMLVARLLKLSESGKWSESSVQTEFGITTNLRVQLTNEEMFFLKKFKRPVLV